MQKFHFWKIVVVSTVVIFGGIYSLPNIFPPDPAVQITLNNPGEGLNNDILNSIESKVSESGLSYLSAEGNSNAILFRAKNYEGIENLEKNSIDFYASVKSLYLQDRQQKILNSNTIIDTQNDSDWEEIENQ